MKISIKKDFRDDAVTREAGEKLRKRIIDSLRAGARLELDFSECLIASTSFFDEGIAKLVDEGIQPDMIVRSLTITHLHPRDRELLEVLCKRRKFEAVGSCLVTKHP